MEPNIDTWSIRRIITSNFKFEKGAKYKYS